MNQKEKNDLAVGTDEWCRYRYAVEIDSLDEMGTQMRAAGIQVGTSPAAIARRLDALGVKRRPRKPRDYAQTGKLSQENWKNIPKIREEYDRIMAAKARGEKPHTTIAKLAEKYDVWRESIYRVGKRKSYSYIPEAKTG